MLQPQPSGEPIAAPLGTWTVDLRKERCFLDRELAWLFGVTEEQGKAGVSADELMQNVALPDREGMLAQWQSAKDAGTLYDIRCRIKTPDGVFQPIRSIGACHRDENGEPYLFSGQIIALQSLDDAAPASIIDFLIRHTQQLAETRKNELLVYLLEMARQENERSASDLPGAAPANSVSTH